MSLKDTCKNLRTLLQGVCSDLDRAENGNKAAAQRVRTGTIKLEKVAKLFRKESIKGERSGGSKKKKAAPAKASAKKAKKAKSKPKASAKRATARIVKKKKK